MREDMMQLLKMSDVVKVLVLHKALPKLMTMLFNTSFQCLKSSPPPCTIQMNGTHIFPLVTVAVAEFV